VQVLRSLCLAPRPGARLLPALRPLPPAELTPAVAGIAGLLAVTVVADVWVVHETQLSFRGGKCKFRARSLHFRLERYPAV